jgi:hypothetical protein
MITQDKLLDQLREYCGERIQFLSGKSYYWSPQEKTVFYREDDKTQVGLWTLFHEACHGILSHKNYSSDFELVLLEVEAWRRAEKLASDFGLKIDHDHVQDCLDSYRDWQYKRSLCPRCDLGGIQLNQKTYSCIFCHDTWQVSRERFSRPYRNKTAK